MSLSLEIGEGRFRNLRIGRREVIVIAVIGMIIVSLIYSQRIFRYPPAERKDVIGIIRLEGYILDSETVNRYISLINEALTNETVKAVVLTVDSGGGYADYVEEIYYNLLELDKEKPLIASVTRALSGGYYITVASRYIFVKDSSLVGNIGVIGIMPPTLIPSEIIVESGPYKFTGESKLSRFFTISRVLDSFLSAVQRGRGENLNVSLEELRKAGVYLGWDAVRLGLADGFGGLQAAIKKAAEEAGLIVYEAEELRLKGENASSAYSTGPSTWWGNVTLKTLVQLHPPPSIYYIYLPPQAITESEASVNPEGSLSSLNIKGDVLIDLSHGNRVSWWVLDILIAELAKRNVTVSFISQWGLLESRLSNASTLIIASPTVMYSEDEARSIVRFVEDGRLLLVFYDPAWEHIGPSGLTGGVIAQINSLTTRFGFSFAKGYLYNEVNHYGLYRNIYLRNFTDTPITQNIETLVFFTATHIYSAGGAAAWTSNDTYSSVAEKADSYTAILWMRRGRGAVAAFGDLTFLREPYCYVEDNYRLIMNLVSLITGVEVEVEAEERALEEIEGSVDRPELPVGTEKNYTEWVDGKEQPLRWFKVSETEVRVERPNRTTHYYFTEDMSLWRWVSDGMECIYEDPLPEPPFPLTRGERWEYESNYTLTVDGAEYEGRIFGEEEVEGFEEILAGDGRSYFCARVRYRSLEYLMIDGGNLTMITEGRYWVSSEAGTVKQEAVTDYYRDGAWAGREVRSILLRSIRKG